MLLAVAGMVGTGKTTLSRALAARFGLQLALESVDADNPWLEKFYGPEPDAKESYALPLQLFFLATRFAALRQMRRLGGSWVLDRTWYEDAEVFARGLYEQGFMSAPEHDLYDRLYAELLFSPAARPPRLMVYLHGPLGLVVERIETRGRPAEREMSRDYWAQLHARYERWIAGFRRCPVLSIDVREYDLVLDAGAVDRVAARIRERLDAQLPQTELFESPQSALSGQR